MTVNKEDLGVDPLTNIRTFKVTDAATGTQATVLRSGPPSFFTAAATKRSGTVRVS